MTYEQKHPLRIVALIGLAMMLAALAVDMAKGADIDAASCRVGLDYRECPKSGCRIATNWVSGTLIDDSHVLTVSHLFDGAPQRSRLYVMFDGREFPATLAKRDRKADLALLKITTGQPRWQIMPPGSGDSIAYYVKPTGWTDQINQSCVFAVCGFGGGQYQRFSGTFDRWWGYKDGIHTFSLNIVTRRGDSGSGVFDQNGRLVGVVWGCEEGMEGVPKGQGKAHVTSGRPLVNFLYGEQ